MERTHAVCKSVQKSYKGRFKAALDSKYSQKRNFHGRKQLKIALRLVEKQTYLVVYFHVTRMPRRAPNDRDSRL